MPTNGLFRPFLSSDTLFSVIPADPFEGATNIRWGKTLGYGGQHWTCQLMSKSLVLVMSVYLNQGYMSDSIVALDVLRCFSFTHVKRKYPIIQ